MKELISEYQAHALVTGLSIAVVVAALAWAAWAGRREDGVGLRLVWLKGLFFALLGPLLFILWNLYNTIEDHYGLDSVKALLINLAIFLAVAFLATLAYYRLPSWAARGKSQRRR